MSSLLEGSTFSRFVGGLISVPLLLLRPREEKKVKSERAKMSLPLFYLCWFEGLYLCQAVHSWAHGQLTVNDRMFNRSTFVNMIVLAFGIKPLSLRCKIWYQYQKQHHNMVYLNSATLFNISWHSSNISSTMWFLFIQLTFSTQVSP